MTASRDNLPEPSPGEPLAEERPSYIYEVFHQSRRSAPHVHVGNVNAVDDQMALDFARETFVRRRPCVHLWVVRREHLAGTPYDLDDLTRSTDHSYREASAYQDVRKKWEQFRTRKDVDEYQKEDLKEAW